MLLKGKLLRVCLRGFLAIALIEAVDAAGSVNKFLFSGEKRVTGRADFNMKVALARRTGLESLATSARDADFGIFRVNSWFHYFFSR